MYTSSPRQSEFSDEQKAKHFLQGPFFNNTLGSTSSLSPRRLALAESVLETEIEVVLAAQRRVTNAYMASVVEQSKVRFTSSICVNRL